MALQKARVQLLDPDTGTVIAEVDVLTSAPVVAYVNDNKTVRDYRGIPAGTDFSEDKEKSVQDVLDGLLYPYTTPDISFITDNEGNELVEDKTIYVERFNEVRPFFITANIVAGDKTDLTISLKRYNMQDGTTETIDTTAKVEPGSTYKYQQEVEKFYYDTKFQIIVSDGKTLVKSPVISFVFIYPIFVGYCNIDEILTDNGATIDDAKASNYFNTLIRNGSPLIEKRTVPIQDIKGISIDNILYHDQQYNPCIIYPNTWNKLVSITDANDDNITGSFLYNFAVPVQINPSVSTNVQYTVYANRNKYVVQLAAAGAIWYNFIEGRGSLDHIEEGVPSLTGFDVLAKLPVDLRTVVGTYDQLYEIEYPYDGLIVYVKDEKTFFKYTESEDPKWSPTNQQMYIQSTGEEPSLDIGQWGDIVIDIKSGIFYQKHKNIRWEEKGRLSGGGSTPIDNWESGKSYSQGTIVYHNDKYWVAVSETTSEPGTDDTWDETTVGGGIPGPIGPPGDAATIVIVETLTGEPGTPALVENLGDKQNARLRFTIPRGEKGEKGDKGDSAVGPDDLPAATPETFGHVLVSNGDGTYKLVDFDTLFNEGIKDMIARGLL